MVHPLVLVTGFGPFGDVAHNPSGLLAEELQRQPPEGVRIEARVLSVTFAGVPGELAAFVASAAGPAALLSIGVHPGAGFRLERRARAEPTSSVVDTSGVVGAGLTAARERECELDLEALVAALAPAAVTVSDDAGGYVCDWTYQHLLQHGERLGVPALFLHVPPLERTPLAAQLPLVSRLVQELVSR
jgi:pyroglutamyl-peptidase